MLPSSDAAINNGHKKGCLHRATYAYVCVCMYVSCTVTGLQYSIIVIIIIYFSDYIVRTFAEPKQLPAFSWPAIKIYAASQLNFRLFSKLKLIEMCKMSKEGQGQGQGGESLVVLLWEQCFH